MKYSQKKIQSFGKIFGGKLRYARQYVSLFPDMPFDSTYLEPFAGGAGILLNKSPHKREIISDKDKEIVNIFRQMKINPVSLKKEIVDSYYNYSEETFNNAKTRLRTPFLKDCDMIERAAAYIAANRMSRLGLGEDYAKQKRLRGGQMGDKNAWENFLSKHYYETAKRIRGVEIRNQCALEILSNPDEIFGRVLCYLDPPYLGETRVSKNIYRHEFDKDEHIKLLEIIKHHPWKIFISGYDSELYQEYLSGWKIHSFDRPSDAGQTKKKSRRVEMVWENR